IRVMEDFIVDRRKLVGLTAMTCVLVLALAAEDSARAQRSGAPAAGPVGIFESHGDVGVVLHPGSVEYDATKHSYAIAGSGENMWFGGDAFQFVWKKISAHVTLPAATPFSRQA